MALKNDSYNEIFKAYVDFVSSVTKTGTEVYAKTWQDATHLNEVVAKNSQDVLKTIPMYKTLSELWTEHNPWVKK